MTYVGSASLEKVITVILKERQAKESRSLLHYLLLRSKVKISFHFSGFVLTAVSYLMPKSHFNRQVVSMEVNEVFLYVYSF
jgi:hypothetical protein